MQNFMDTIPPLEFLVWALLISVSIWLIQSWIRCFAHSNFHPPYSFISFTSTFLRFVGYAMALPRIIGAFNGTNSIEEISQALKAIGKSVDDYDFERLMHLDFCMRVHLKGHDDYELKLVANPALSMEQVRTLTAILKLGGLTKDEMTYVADPYNSPKAMEYISSAICNGLPLKEAVMVAEILNFRPDELEK